MLVHRLVSLVVSALVVSSCVLPVRVTGSVTFAWSVGGASSRRACTDRGATSVRVVVRDDVNAIVALATTPCESFRSRHLLDRGWYDASLTLLDAEYFSVSEMQETRAFYIAPRVDSFVEVAFAPSAPPP